MHSGGASEPPERPHGGHLIVATDLLRFAHRPYQLVGTTAVRNVRAADALQGQPPAQRPEHDGDSDHPDHVARSPRHVSRVQIMGRGAFYVDGCYRPSVRGIRLGFLPDARL